MKPSAVMSMLVVSDVESAVEFYRQAFGMDFAVTPFASATCEQGTTLFGLYEADGKWEGGRSLPVIVENLDDARERAVPAGAGVKLAPKVRRGKRTAEYLDLDGNVVVLHESVS